MRKWFFFGLLIVMVVVSLLFSACTKTSTTSSATATSSTTAATPTQTITTTTATGNWWDKFGTPKYGGNINVYAQSLDTVSVDPLIMAGGMYSGYWREGLFYYDWTLDKNIFNPDGGFTPPDYLQGLIVEKWEYKDSKTITVKLHEGIYWQDKAPVNGREMTADDIVYNYDRVLGTGSGFTEPSMMAANLSSIEKVSATGKYTVDFLFKSASVANIFQVATAGMGSVSFVPPEWVKQGDLTTWTTAVGSGPWILSDLVVGNSMTLVRNENYWGYDERYPKNKLPYLDSVKMIAIPDIASTLAALRTGKLDMTITGGTFTWQNVEAVAGTSPEIKSRLCGDISTSLDMRCDKTPFTDIRVRKAMQMAIDRQAIARTIYGGYVNGKPAGLIHPSFSDWTVPYDEWPSELQAEYSYNPQKARALLAEAGYPDGFQTHIFAPPTISSELILTCKAFFMDIGIDMEIRNMELAILTSYTNEGKHEQLVAQRNSGMFSAPHACLSYSVTSNRNNKKFNSDSTYDDMYNHLTSTVDMTEAKKISKEADMYAISQHWSVNICPGCTGIFWHEDLKGYSGEFAFFPNLAAPTWARIWLDR